MRGRQASRSITRRDAANLCLRAGVRSSPLKRVKAQVRVPLKAIRISRPDWQSICWQMVLKSTRVVPLTDVKSFQRQSIAAILEERPLFEEDERIAKAVGHLRESGNYEVFLAQGRHYASVTVRDLMNASDPLNTKLGTVAYLVPEVPRTGTIAEAARLMYDHRLRALPTSTEPAAFAAASVWGILKQMKESLDLPVQ